MDIATFKKKFDRELERFFRHKLRECREKTSDAYLGEMIRHAEKLVMSGGKRIRPYLAHLSYKNAGGRNDAAAIKVFIGLEIFHSFALVHDDIMDRGMERHGVATAHRLYGDAQAILIGDLLFNWAAEIIAPTKGQPVFAKMVDEVILGQMLDVDAIRRTKVTDRFIEDKMRLKTASYSFIRPLQFGAALAGKPQLFKFCEQFGLPLGLAFQIQDDWLDLIGSTKNLGKSAFNDVKEGQKTVFTQRAPSLGKYKGKKLGATQKKEIRNILEKSGAIEYGRKKMEGYFKQAEKAAQGKKEFLGIVQYIRSRAK